MTDDDATSLNRQLSLSVSLSLSLSLLPLSLSLSHTDSLYLSLARQLDFGVAAYLDKTPKAIFIGQVNPQPYTLNPQPSTLNPIP